MLVSVVVTSYQSARFIVETLESVKAQTYPEIELIVSDDGSTDETIDLARGWLELNGSRFVRTDLVTVPVNTGVSANCNRSIAASRAEWIKFIAGDDILLPNCIEDNMSYVVSHPDTKVLFSYVRLYENRFDINSFLRVIPSEFPNNIMAPEYSAGHQYKLLLLSDRIRFTPSYFFKKSAILSVGGYDSRNSIVEDYPMWLKLTKAGIRLDFMEKETVGYRQHRNATNNHGTVELFSLLVLKTYSFRKESVFPYLPWDIVGAERWTMKVRELFVQLNWNKRNSVMAFLFQLGSVYLNPFQYIISFRKRALGVGRVNIFYAN